MSPTPPPKVRCRRIDPADLDAIADLLTVGFPRRSKSYWLNAFEYLTKHRTPEGYPKYGYLVETGNRLLGVILLIFASVRNSGTVSVRCNISSWYVEPAFRNYASLLVSQALKHRATYVNVSPARHTWRTIEAQGFRRFCDGVFVAVPAVYIRPGKAKVHGVEDLRRLTKPVPSFELDLLQTHDEFGCISIWCEGPRGGYPFIFRRRFIKDVKLLACAQLIYCNEVSDLVRVAGAVGRFLALRGMPFILVPTNGPIPNLVGKYYGDKPMYYRGLDRPRLGDLAYTEGALFGF